MDERDRPQQPQDDPRVEEAEQQQLQRLRRERQARVAKAVVVLAIVILLIVFVTQNLEEVPIDFVFVEASFPLIWVLIFTAVLGGVVGYLLGRPSGGRRAQRDE